MNKLVLVDAKNVLYRSYYAPSVKDSEFRNNAIRGFIYTLRSIFKFIKPTHIVVCNDSPVNFRKDKLATYKAHRKPPEPALVEQMDVIDVVSEALGLPFVEVKGYECDDVIGTLAIRGAREGYKVFIYSNDKDFLMLLDDDIVTINFDKHGDIIYFTDELVHEKYGITSEQFRDYLALVGDVADGYKGARGIGPKNALNLLSAYETIEGIYEHLDELKSAKQRQSFIDNKEEVLQSQDLATIITDVPIDRDMESFRYIAPDKEKCVQIFSALEMEDMVEQFQFKLAI